MKTRIISGIIMGFVVLGFLTAGYLVNPFIITLFVAVLASMATYELIHNVAKIEDKFANTLAMIYTLFAVINLALGGYKIGEKIIITVAHITVVYILIAVFLTLKNHKSFTLASIISLCAMPLFMAYGFAGIEGIANFGASYKIQISPISTAQGIYYLLMLLNFSSLCDMGAYFVGVTMGKHKLCPQISPKKTVEGAIGGILTSIVFSLIYVFAFSMTEKLVPTLILTIPLCIVGMCGDLFASCLKRAVGIKDYSNLIPGHGGVLDRFDSILLIAPIYHILIGFGVL